MNEYNCMHILGSERKNRNLENIQKKRHRFNMGKTGNYAIWAKNIYNHSGSM